MRRQGPQTAETMPSGPFVPPPSEPYAGPQPLPPGHPDLPQPKPAVARPVPHPEAMPLAEFRKAARQRVPAALEHIDAILHTATQYPAFVKHGDILKAVEILLDRSYGKAVQPIEIGGPGTFDHMTDEELNAYIETTSLELKATEVQAPDA